MKQMSLGAAGFERKIVQTFPNNQYQNKLGNISYIFYFCKNTSNSKNDSNLKIDVIFLPPTDNIAYGTSGNNSEDQKNKDYAIKENPSNQTTSSPSSLSEAIKEAKLALKEARSAIKEAKAIFGKSPQNTETHTNLKKLKDLHQHLRITLSETTPLILVEIGHMIAEIVYPIFTGIPIRNYKAITANNLSQQTKDTRTKIEIQKYLQNNLNNPNNLNNENDSSNTSKDILDAEPIYITLGHQEPQDVLLTLKINKDNPSDQTYTYTIEYPGNIIKLSGQIPKTGITEKNQEIEIYFYPIIARTFLLAKCHLLRNKLRQALHEQAEAIGRSAKPRR